MTETQKTQRYQRIYGQLKELFLKTDNRLSRMATAAALLHHKMPDFFWTGFYLLDKADLCVGPYQGPLACQVLERKKGVCWEGVLEKRTIVVPDVHKYPGHIACDSRANSEIVVPLMDSGENPIGVLDVDSQKYGFFNKPDKIWLEKIVTLI